MSWPPPDIILAIGIATGPTLATGITAFFTYLNARELREIAELSKKTHDIINSQGTQMVNKIADLTARIAEDNPRDRPAQVAAAAALQVQGDKKDVDAAAAGKAELTKS